MFRDEYTLLAFSMVSGSGHCYWGPEPEYIPSFLGGQNVRRSACITKHHLGHCMCLNGITPILGPDTQICYLTPGSRDLFLCLHTWAKSCPYFLPCIIFKPLCFRPFATHTVWLWNKYFRASRENQNIALEIYHCITNSARFT